MTRKWIFAPAFAGAMALAQAAAADTLTINFAPAAPPPAAPFGPWALAAIAVALLLAGLAVLRMKGGARVMGLTLAAVAGLSVVGQSRPAHAISPTTFDLTTTTSPQTVTITTASVTVTNHTGAAIIVGSYSVSGSSYALPSSNPCGAGTNIANGASCSFNLQT